MLGIGWLGSPVPERLLHYTESHNNLMGLIITHLNYNNEFRTLQTRFPTLISHIHIIEKWMREQIDFFLH